MKGIKGKEWITKYNPFLKYGLMQFEKTGL